LYLYFVGCSNAEIVFKQAKLETAHFKSGIFKRANNLFGMKYSTKRKNTASGFILADLGKVATYRHWTCSVDDYLIWQNTQMPKFYTGDYYQFLELAGYATNERYNEILKRIK
jgi:flagellum-specific peptidoglycan hydrolase FlgJ